MDDRDFSKVKKGDRVIVINNNYGVRVERRVASVTRVMKNQFQADGLNWRKRDGHRVGADFSQLHVEKATKKVLDEVREEARRRSCINTIHGALQREFDAVDTDTLERFALECRAGLEKARRG